MKSPRNLVIRKLSLWRLLVFLRRNPRLTAAQYGRLLGKPYGTISARLYRLWEAGVVRRVAGQGATQDVHKTWRYSL